MAESLEKELLAVARERYRSEKQDLLSVLDLKNREAEELRGRIQELVLRNEEAERLLREEESRRVEELGLHQHEILELQKRFKNDQIAVQEEMKASQAVVQRLNEQIVAYKTEIKELLEENEKEIEAAQKDLASREMQLESLRAREADLERKMAEVENAARQERKKLESKVAEMEQLMSKERENKKVFELETKNALALSTASLLEGRSEGAALKQQVDMLSARIRELEAEKGKIIDDWQAERRKWEDMWQRERAVWESQRFQAQEQGSRTLKEKAQWESWLRAKEAKEIKMTRMFSSFLSELNRWKNEIQIFPSRGASPEDAEETQAPSAAPVSRRPRRAFLAGLAAVVLAVAGIGGWKYWQIHSRPVVFSQQGSWTLPVATPSGIAGDPAQGGLLWLADWKTGEIVQVDRSDPSNILGRFKTALSFFHPNSIALSSDGRHLFSLDSVSHKIYKHEAADPSKILEEIAAPSPSSLFLALVEGGGNKNGRLAVMDSIEKKAHFYDPSALQTKPESFDLPQDVSPIAANGGRYLWVMDADSGKVLGFEIRNGKALRISVKMEPKVSPELGGAASASGLLVMGDEAYFLFEGEPGKLVLLKK